MGGFCYLKKRSIFLWCMNAKGNFYRSCFASWETFAKE